MVDKSKSPTKQPVDPSDDGNAAANGHWQHDKAGPRRYVPPASDTTAGKEPPDDTHPKT